MPRDVLAVAFCLTALAAMALSRAAVPAQPAAGASARKLLYPTDQRDVPPALRPHIERLLAPDQKPVEPGDAKAAGVYLRVLSRQHALDGAKLKPGGWVGTRPFMFLTVPDAACGRDLLGTLSAIGYDPEDILETEKGVEKVAVLFKYPDNRTCSAGSPSRTRARRWECRGRSRTATGSTRGPGSARPSENNLESARRFSPGRGIEGRSHPWS